MSQDSPDIPEILRTVREFAERVASRSAGAERYDALCAAFLIEVVQRELSLGQHQDELQATQLRHLTGEQGDLADLYRHFSKAVRGGDYDDNWQPAFDFALRQVIDKVLITNPNHLAPQHRN